MEEEVIDPNSQEEGSLNSQNNQREEVINSEENNQNEQEEVIDPNLQITPDPQEESFRNQENNSQNSSNNSRASTPPRTPTPTLSQINFDNTEETVEGLRRRINNNQLTEVERNLIERYFVDNLTPQQRRVILETIETQTPSRTPSRSSSGSEDTQNRDLINLEENYLDRLVRQIRRRYPRDLALQRTVGRLVNEANQKEHPQNEQDIIAAFQP